MSDEEADIKDEDSSSCEPELSIQTVIKENYALLCNTITDIVDPLMKYLAEEKTFTLKEEKQVSEASEKVRLLLNTLLESDDKRGIYMMLKIMKEHGGKGTQNLADHIMNRVKISPNELLQVIEDSKGYIQPKENERPRLKDIENTVAIKCATIWKQLGRNLKIKDDLLKIIEADYPHDSETCCGKMLGEWLDLTPGASWKLLNDAIEKTQDEFINESNSKPVYRMHIAENTKLNNVAENEMAKFDNHIRLKYKISKHLKDKDEWPPIHSKKFVNLMLIHHSEKVSKKMQHKTAASILQKSCTKLFAEQTYSTDISDIFKFADGVASNSSRLILIDGDPGIGKTMLSKEIAYRWACNELLLSEQLMLLVFLRDPKVHTIRSVHDFVHFMYNRFDKQYTDESAKCAKVILDTNGKNITIILDGYDEMPHTKESDHFITNLLKREILPQCTIVVTSRPRASVRLGEEAIVKVEIFGFTEKNKQNFINSELKDNPDKLLKVTSCLRANSNLNHLCNNPFIITVLVYLARDCGELPTTQHELYKKFVDFIISHSLHKLDDSIKTFSTIDDLPEKYNDYFLELCRYAFVALNDDKFVFTSEDIKKECPKFADAPGEWSGLGLLKLTKYFSTEENNDCTSYNFMHLSIQEYLAAYHISTLALSQQVVMLRNYFFDKRYLNMWIMYVGLCKETLPFTHFIAGNKFIVWSKLFKSLSLSHRIVKSKLDRLYLFQIFAEFSSTKFNSTNIQDLVSSIFQNKHLDLSKLTLSKSNIGTLTFLLHRITIADWNELNLSHCHIGDKGCSQLCESEAMTNLNRELHFNTINLSHNDLTLDIVEKVTEMLLKCRTKVCDLSGNPIVGRTVDVSYIAMRIAFSEKSISHLLSLHIQNQENPIFNEVNKDKIIEHLSDNFFRITGLYFRHCKFNNEIMETMKYIISRRQLLSKLYIWNSDLKDKDVRELLKVMPIKNTQQVLFIHESSIISCDLFPLPGHKFTFMLVSKLCLILERATSLEISYMFFSKSVKVETERLQYIYLLHCTLDYEVASQLKGLFTTCKFISKFVLDGNSFDTNVLKLFLDNLHLFPMLESVFVCHTNVRSRYLITMANKLSCKHLSITVMNQDVFIGIKSNEEQLKYAIDTGIKFTTLILKHCSITKCKEDLFRMIKSNQKLSNVLLHYSLNDEFASKLLDLLKDKRTIKVLDIQDNQMSKEVIESLANVIKRNRELQELCLHFNNLESGLIIILSAIQDISSLRILALSKSNISEEKGEQLAAAINANNILEKVYLGNNQLHSSAINVAAALSNLSTLRELDLSNIRSKWDRLSNSIAAVIAGNPHFTSLGLINNNLQSENVLVIAEALTHVTTVKILNFQQNQITDKAAKALASVILQNTGLQKLCLGNNFLQTEVKDIAKALTKISSLRMLDLNNNPLSRDVGDDLATAVRANGLLEKVWLGNSNLGPSIIPTLNALKRISSLKELNLNGVKYKSENLICEIASIFERSSIVKDLRLSNNDINFNSLTKLAETLSNVSSLEVLDISNNLITEVAASAVANIISSNTNFKKLYLGNNQLHNGIIKIAKSIETVNALEVLDVVNNNVMPDSCNHLATAVISQPLIELKVAYNNLRSSGFSAIATGLKSFSTLVCLQIDGINIDSAVSEDLREVIVTNSSLQSISLSSNLLKESLLKLTGACVNLRKLYVLGLSSNCVPPAIVTNLATSINRCLSLNVLLFGNITLDFHERLLLNGTQYFNKVSVNHFPRSQGEVNHINHLVNILCFEVIKIEMIEYFVAHYNMSWQYTNIPFSLYWYTNFFNDTIYDKSFTKQIVQEAKKKLSLIDSKAMVLSLQIIRTLKVINLENNNIDEDAATELAGHLHCNNILEQLWLRGNKLHVKGASVVLQSLCNLSTLLILDLSYNHLTSESADGIAVVIGNNCSLQQLWLDGNDLLTRGVVIIANALKKLFGLRTLSLCSNGITDNAAEEISDVITSNVLMVDLLLGNNQLQATGVCKIAIALRKLVMLKKLDLFNNQITAGVAELAATLSNCTNLQQLFLSDNMLETEGTIKIASALKCINSLQVLTLSNNNITEDATGVLLDVFKNNVSLKIILLGGNNLQTNGISLIVETCKSMAALQLLDISFNKVGEDEKENLKDSLLTTIHFVIV